MGHNAKVMVIKSPRENLLKCSYTTIGTVVFCFFCNSGVPQLEEKWPWQLICSKEWFFFCCINSENSNMCSSCVRCEKIKIKKVSWATRLFVKKCWRKYYLSVYVFICAHCIFPCFITRKNPCTSLKYLSINKLFQNLFHDYFKG